MQRLVWARGSPARHHAKIGDVLVRNLPSNIRAAALPPRISPKPPLVHVLPEGG
ncbi:MAG: hypothetical protein ACJAVR_000193 [Paracoccaceae bacterium]